MQLGFNSFKESLKLSCSALNSSEKLSCLFWSFKANRLSSTALLSHRIHGCLVYLLTHSTKKINRMAGKYTIHGSYGKGCPPLLYYELFLFCEGLEASPKSFFRSYGLPSPLCKNNLCGGHSETPHLISSNSNMQPLHVPASWKWSFDSPNGGHLGPEKVTYWSSPAVVTRFGHANSCIELLQVLLSWSLRLPKQHTSPNTARRLSSFVRQRPGRPRRSPGRLSALVGCYFAALHTSAAQKTVAVGGQRPTIPALPDSSVKAGAVVESPPGHPDWFLRVYRAPPRWTGSLSITKLRWGELTLWPESLLRIHVRTDLGNPPALKTGLFSAPRQHSRTPIAYWWLRTPKARPCRRNPKDFLLQCPRNLPTNWHSTVRMAEKQGLIISRGDR